MQLATTHTGAPQHISWFAGLTNAAGGLAYHWLALRQRRALWTPYRLAVATHLRAWAPLEQELVLIGPSAGWNLDSEFLMRFQLVHAIEPDPLARWLLRRRFPLVRWQMATRDYFDPAAPQGWTANLASLFSDYPSQALLFFGFLGQMVVLHPDAVAQEQGTGVVATAAFRRWKSALQGHLAQRSWCSLHDRWVGHSAPKPEALSTDGATLARESSDPMHLWPRGAHVVDVFTDGLVPNQNRQLLLWRRMPDRWHAMELAWSRREGNS